jgi:general secretion pathway protein I
MGLYEKLIEPIGICFRCVVHTIVTGCERNDAVDRSGFTFIEVLMAVSILAVLLVGVHKLQSQLVDVNMAARFLTQAPLLAQNRLAELERNHFKDVEKNSGDFGPAFPGYSWSLVIETIDSDILKKAASPMKKIEVSILLNKGERTYRLRAYRAVSDPAETPPRIKHTGLS